MAGVAAALIALPLALPTVASATGNHDYSKNPPAPSECKGYLWTQDVHAEGAQKLSKDNPWIKIEGLQIPAGEVYVTEAITWDDRTGWWRELFDNWQVEIDHDFDWNTNWDFEFPHDLDDLLPFEKYEKMRVDFWVNNDWNAATPEHTPDLADHKLYPSAVADLGSTVLSQGSDAVYLKHSSTFMDTDDKQNDFYPVSVCIEWDAWTANPEVAFSANCTTAAVTMTNSGKIATDLDVTVNGKTETTTVDPGANVVKNVALVEDTSTTVKVTDGDVVLLNEVVKTDCVAPPSSTVPPTTAAPTTVVPTETVVLAEVETAPELAFTGSDANLKLGLGAALLGSGLALIGLGRRRRTTQA
jgi:hypothetical protein